MILAQTLDGLGIYGSLFHFTMAVAFFGSALMVFIYLWRKGNLDMNEGPALSMLEEEKGNGKEKNDDDKQ